MANNPQVRLLGPQTYPELLAGVSTAARRMFGDAAKIHTIEKTNTPDVGRCPSQLNFEIWCYLPDIQVGKYSLTNLAWLVQASVANDKTASLQTLRCYAGNRDIMHRLTASERAEGKVNHPRTGTAPKQMPCTDLDPTCSRRVYRGQYMSALGDAMGALMNVGSRTSFFKCMYCDETRASRRKRCSSCGDELCLKHAEPCPHCGGLYCPAHMMNAEYDDGDKERCCTNCFRISRVKCPSCNKRGESLSSCDGCGKDMCIRCTTRCDFHYVRIYRNFCGECVRRVTVPGLGRYNICQECHPDEGGKVCAAARKSDCRMYGMRTGFSSFTPDGRTADGYSKYCISCQKRRREEAVKRKNEKRRAERRERERERIAARTEAMRQLRIEQFGETAVTFKVHYDARTTREATHWGTINANSLKDGSWLDSIGEPLVEEN